MSEELRAALMKALNIARMTVTAAERESAQLLDEAKQKRADIAVLECALGLESGGSGNGDR